MTAYIFLFLYNINADSSERPLKRVRLYLVKQEEELLPTKESSFFTNTIASLKAKDAPRSNIAVPKAILYSNATTKVGTINNEANPNKDKVNLMPIIEDKASSLAN